MNRIWTYIISQPLSEENLDALNNLGLDFVSNWIAHSQKLAAEFEILNGRIVVVKVHENIANASGCSIDKLLHFIKNFESRFGIELLNRLLVVYKNGDKMEVAHASRIQDLILSGTINENTIVYNTAISKEEEFKTWEQPLKDTWLSKYLSKA
jgi:hypothetical protein